MATDWIRCILRKLPSRNSKSRWKQDPNKQEPPLQWRRGSPTELADRLKLDKGLGFLVRSLDTRVHLLYDQLTAQTDITPRQFGVLLMLYQQGSLTLTELARHIRIDRSTLGGMINRMADRSLTPSAIMEAIGAPRRSCWHRPARPCFSRWSRGPRDCRTPCWRPWPPKTGRISFDA